MSICDKITDRDLELIASALRKLVTAMDGAGIYAHRHLTFAETNACVHLSSLCQAGPIEVNGDTDEERR